MQSYFVRFGRRHRLPSTVEILDELRSGTAVRHDTVILEAVVAVAQRLQ